MSIVTDQEDFGAFGVVLAWMVAAFTFAYMAPLAVAMTRGKSNSAAVGLVNLLTGWTIVGWIVALAMACTPHQVIAYERSH